MPDEIGELKEPEGLNVRKNQLTVSSSHIKHLSKLQRLDFSDNQLTKLPDEIGELKELVGLNVGNNQLTAITSHVKHLNEHQIMI